jgi:carbon monoxide dehydrogenase subunit G
MKKRGRPPKLPEERQDIVLRVRMTREAYQRFAESVGERSMSQVVRTLIAHFVQDVEKSGADKSWRVW